MKGARESVGERLKIRWVLERGRVREGEAVLREEWGMGRENVCQ